MRFNGVLLHMRFRVSLASVNDRMIVDPVTGRRWKRGTGTPGPIIKRETSGTRTRGWRSPPAGNNPSLTRQIESNVNARVHLQS